MAQAAERIYRLVVDASQANRQLGNINRNTQGLANRFNQLQRAAYQAFAAFGAIKGLTAITKANDQIELLHGSMEALTGSAERADDMMGRIFNTVATTGASLEDTSSTFQRLTIGFQELGGTNEQIEAVANTFIKLGRVSGTSMFDTNAALVQFSQGLASGKLQGDELRSIMERLPLITQLIAEEFSLVNDNIEVTRGQVKQLGREGKITAQIMGNALLRASEEIAKTFDGLVFTLEQEINSFLATTKIALAGLSTESGIGEGLKNSIKAANETLMDIMRNIPVFISDMKKLGGILGINKQVLKDWAFTVALVAVPAIFKLETALKNLVKRNPLGVFFTLASIAITLWLKNWDQIRLFFLYQVPAWFYSLLAVWQETMAKMSLAVQGMWTSIKNFFIEGINDVIRKLNEWSEVIKEFSGDKVDLGTINLVGLAESEEAYSKFTDKAIANTEKAAAITKEYWKLLSELGKTVEGADLNLFDKIVTDSSGIEAFNKSLDKMLEDIRLLEDPMYKINEQLELAQYWMSLGQLTAEQYETYRAGITGETKKKEDEAKAWAAYVDEIERALDPSIALREEQAKLDKLFDKGIINMVEYGILLQEYKDSVATTADGVKETVEGLSADLAQAGNAFLESFTTGLADALLEGELNFGDFAKTILEDLARMILRAVLFNSLMSALDGTAFGNYLSTGASGGNVNGRSATTYADGGGSEHNVGVLTTPTYGRGTYSEGASGVSVTVNNNAPVDVQTTSKRNANGGIDIDMIIEQKVNKSISNGGLDSAMKTSFGLTRRAF